MWLNGSIVEVSAMTETFIKERQHNLTGKVEKVGIDDACAFLARFSNGSLAIFEARCVNEGLLRYTAEPDGVLLQGQVECSGSRDPERGMP